MFDNLSHYKLSIYLMSAMALSDCIVLAFYIFSGVGLVNAFVYRTIFSCAILCGILIKSNIARYVGAIFYTVSTGYVILGMFSGTNVVWGVGAVWALVVTGLSLPICYVLLISRRFSNEFTNRQQTPPYMANNTFFERYKRLLIWLILTAIIVAAVVATINDIMHLRAS
jgi:hypothetical protein